MTFVNLSFYDPDVYLADSGQLVISNTTNTTNNQNSNETLAIPNTIYQIQNTATKETIERIGAFNELFVANLKVGRLDVSEIDTERIQNLELRLKNLELATTSAVLSASISGLLNNEQLNNSSNSAILSSLTVLGRTVLNDLGITGKVTAGLLSIDGLTSSINSLSDLYIQNEGVGGVNILNGKVTIDTSGNLKVQKISIDESDTNNKSVGSVVLAAGQTEVQVQTSALTPNSYVFATPDKPVSVGVRTNEGTIFVSIKEVLPEDVRINWWVVN